MDDSKPIVDITDDLSDFETQFYGKDEPKPDVVDEPVDEVDEQVEETDEEVDGSGDEVETPATDEDDDEGEEEEEEPDEEPAPKPKKKSFQERINELTAKAREAEREKADLLRRFEELEASVREKKEDKPVETAKPRFDEDGPNPDELNEDGTPKYELGEFDPSFIRDLTRFTILKETEAVQKAQEEKKHQEALEAAQAELQTQWASKLEKVEETIPDVREKIVVLEETFANIDPGLGEYLATTIMSCDHGPEILYYLSNNIGEAQKIVASGAAAATLAIGRLEATLSRTDEPEKKRNKVKQTEAPEPPVDRSRGSGAKRTTAADTDDLNAFEVEFFNKKK